LDLIKCEKQFISQPKKPIVVNRNEKQKFYLSAPELKAVFEVFFSVSLRMPEDFSLGLMYDNFLLFRCNGFHGTTSKGFFSSEHHAYPHSHILTANDIENGRIKKPSLIADLTGKYIDLDGAKLFFFNQCGIIGYERYFPETRQISLFRKE
jgi:hypothetical protein